MENLTTLELGTTTAAFLFNTTLEMSTTAVGHMTTTAVAHMTTAPAVQPDHNSMWGFLSVLMAIVLFGSNLVPVKKFETGDGVFFQWICALGIWLTGLVLYGVRGFPQFHAIAMLGGFLWCTGNMMTVPIIKTIGLGQGILIWASFNLLSGWASGRFGWFWIKPEVPGNVIFNYVGVALCFISAFVYMFMKTNAQSIVASANHGSENGTDVEREPLINQSNDGLPANETRVVETNIFERMPPVPKRIVGTVMSIVAGTLYGLNFAPVIAFKDNHPEASQNGLDYVFSHFCGILLSSTSYFLIYCVVMCNRPRIYNKAILPGFISGIMWGVADMAWFFANDALSSAISFPLITTGPALVGALWGVFFREIWGKRNFLLLTLAFAIAISGSILTGLSKISPKPTGNSTMTYY